jgi:hypothetical protein
MEAKARKLDWRPLAVLTAVVAIALTMWASGAFAAGGSSGSTDSPASDVPSMFVQDGQQGTPSDDCPDGGGGSGGSGADQGSGSGSSEL